MNLILFFKNVLLITLSQLFWLLGPILIFGFILYVLARFTRITYAKTTGKTLDVIITGWLGTPIHELGHAIFCLIFRHRINDIKLYRPNTNDGTLGFVNHSYDPKSFYQRIGNFFIGIGPIVFGSLLILLLLHFLVPNSKEILTTIKSNSKVLADIFDGKWIGFTPIYKYIYSTIILIFQTSNLGSITFWVFIYISLCVSSHMELSPADLKGASLGFISVIVLFLILNSIVLGIEISNANQTIKSFGLLIKIENYAILINRMIGLISSIFLFSTIVSGVNFFVTFIVLNIYNIIRGKNVVNPIW